MIKTELPDLLFDEKAFENIKEQINKIPRAISQNRSSSFFITIGSLS